MHSELKDDVEKIKKFLMSVGAKAIILCGSRAVGDYKDNSDWDLKILSDHMQDSWPPFDPSIELDTTIHSCSTQFSMEEFGLKLRFCEIITDNDNGDANRLVQEAHAYYNRGPEPWSPEYAYYRQSKVRRYENKFKDCIANEEWLQLHQRLNWHFLENSYTWWYGLRAEWEPRPQQIMSDLQHRDPEFASILQKIVHPQTLDIDRVKLYTKLHRHFFSSKEYQDYIKDYNP